MGEKIGMRSRLLQASGLRDWGFWNWDVKDNKLYADPVTERYFSLAPGLGRRGAPLETYLPAVHPDDRERVSQAIERAVKIGEDYQQRYRVQRSDGCYRIVLAAGYCIRDGNGIPIRYPGVISDVTEEELSPRGALAELADCCLAAIEMAQTTGLKEVEKPLAHALRIVATALSSASKNYH